MINVPGARIVPASLRHPLPSRLRLAFMVLLMLEELDLITTLTGHTGVVEGNVLVAGVLAVGGGFAFLLMKSVSSVIVYVSLAQMSRVSRPMAECLVAFASLLMVSVVIGNLRLVLA